MILKITATAGQILFGSLLLSDFQIKNQTFFWVMWVITLVAIWIK